MVRCFYILYKLYSGLLFLNFIIFEFYLRYKESIISFFLLPSFSSKSIFISFSQSCEAGMYSTTSGKPCATCPEGWMQENKGESQCHQAEPGDIVLGGGTSIVLKIQSLRN